MIKRTDQLEPGDVLPFSEGRSEIVETFRIPNDGAFSAGPKGALAGMWKITAKILDVYEGDELIVGKNYITFCDAGRKWRVEGLEELEA